jgi:hypothetical protein
VAGRRAALSWPYAWTATPCFISVARLRESTNTSLGLFGSCCVSLTKPKLAMITRSPTEARRAADPLSETMPLPRLARIA